MGKAIGQKTIDAKITLLVEQYGMSINELLEEYGTDSVAPGICMNPRCGFTAEYEPDQREGWCEECDTPSVRSILILMGVI